MSHERSITVEIDGEFVNLKTVFNGKQLSEKQAVKMFREGRIGPLGGQKFKTLSDAVKAARQRSRAFDGPAFVGGVLGGK